MMADKELTDKQAAFVDAFVVSMNAADAARTAGYADSTVHNATKNILSSPVVCGEIDRRLAEIERHGGWSLRHSIPVALSALVDVAESCKDGKARVNAAREILDRTGLIRREGKDVKGDLSADAIARIQNVLTSALKETLTPEQAARVGRFIKEKLCVGLETG